MVFITTNKVMQAYNEDDFLGIIIYGPPRCGKSSFSIQTLAEVYGKKHWDKELIVDYGYGPTKGGWVIDEYNWNAWKEYLTFLPEEFFGFVDKLQRAEKKAKMLIWDDAALWASEYRWNEEFAKRLGEYLNVVGTDLACLMMTAPNPKWLLTHFRELPDMHLGRVCKISANPYQRSLRYVKIYKGWMAPDLKKTGVKPEYLDYYDSHLPDWVFKEYNEKRRGYAKLAKERCMELIENISNKYTNPERKEEIKNMIVDEFDFAK